MMTTRREVVGLALWLALVFAAAAAGAAFTAPAIPTWYAGLRKPSLTPPNWVFGPVWTLLYVMMAVAAWLVWRRGGWVGARVALALFVVQLAFNVGWSALFFGLKLPGAAFAEIVILWLLILLTALRFRRHSAAGSLLLAPYLLWVSFAGWLNYQVWRLN
jgi:tryptophan-rich sensory protein